MLQRAMAYVHSRPVHGADTPWLSLPTVSTCFALLSSVQTAKPTKSAMVLSVSHATSRLFSLSAWRVPAPHYLASLLQFEQHFQYCTLCL